MAADIQTEIKYLRRDIDKLTARLDSLEGRHLTDMIDWRMLLLGMLIVTALTGNLTITELKKLML